MDWEPGQDPPSKVAFDPCMAAASPAAVSRPHPTPAGRAAAVASNPGAAAGGARLDLKRRLYFLSGFDPRGASFYFRLLSQEVERHNAKTPMGEGQPITLLRRRQEGDRLVSRWRIQRSQPNSSGRSSSHEIGFLHWDDIARSHWPRRSLAMVGEIAEVYRWYLLQGGLLRIARLCPGVALCGAYPGLFTALAVLTALLGGAGLGALTYGALPGPPLALGAAVLVALGSTWLLLLAAWSLADRLGVVWLWRSIRFTHRLGQARDGDLRNRVQALARRILELEAEAPAESVLLVGHSSGSFVMAMLAAELRRQDPAAAMTGRLSLLSLGQNLANLAVYPGAQAFHADLQDLAREPRLPWLDLTSRDDLLCFAGVDPYRSCGLPAPAGPAYPSLQLVALAQPRGRLDRLALAFQQFDLHFRYLRQAPASHGFDPLSQLLKP